MSFTSRVKIEDLINNGSILVHKDGNHGAKYPRTEEFGEVGVPFLTAKLLDSSGNIDLLNAPRLATEKAKKFTFGFVQTEDVLLSHNATVGRVAVMPQVAEPILIGTSLTHFRLDKSKILPTYLAAYFSGKDFQDQLAAVMSQTTRNQVPITSQRKLYIELPSIDIQTEIVKHIDSIDNKIRLNNQINQTLESIAQAIFKSWFIDFEPVRAKIAAKQTGQDPELAAMCAISGKTQAELEQMAKEDFAELQATAALFPDELVESELGEVPKGWEVNSLGNICNFTPGSAFKPEYQGQTQGEIPFIKVSDMNLNGNEIFIVKANNYIDNSLQKERKFKLHEEGATVFAKIGVALISNRRRVLTMPTIIDNNMMSASPLKGLSTPYYLYLLLKTIDFNTLVSGTALPYLNVSDLRKILIVHPTINLLNKFELIANPLLQKIKLNSVQCEGLVTLRDNLLPKLLSGEIDASVLNGEHG